VDGDLGGAAAADVGAGIADVLGLPLEGFTAARDGLARDLRRAGLGDDAARISALRKPGVHLWAANQLARQRPVAVKRLLSTAADLADAQQEVLSGASGAGKRLRRDSGEYQRALDQAARETRALLREAARGTGEETMRRVREVLANAALGNQQRRRELAGGVLAEEPETPGFGLFAPAPAPARRPTARPVAGAGAHAGDGGAEVRASSRAEERERRAAEEAAREETRRRQAELRRELERAEAELHRAEQAGRRLRRRAEATAAEARSAAAGAERAASEVEAARVAAAKVRSRLD
jgi:hypothetical protein